MNNEPAFPPREEMVNAFPGRKYESRDWWSGMTLRDYFAAKAMQGILAAALEEPDWDAITSDNALAKNAYSIADAMLRARG